MITSSGRLLCVVGVRPIVPGVSKKKYFFLDYLTLNMKAL
jgi:hypothetical protein